MKNFKLLMASTAILSMGAFGANADELSTTVHAYADIVGTLTLTEVDPISFGVITAASGTVVIDTAGNVSGTATTIAGGHRARKLQPGIVKLSGSGIDNIHYAATTFIEWVIPDITLKQGTGQSAITCGVVSGMSSGAPGGTTEFDKETDGSILLKYGGTFTLDSGIASHLSNSRLECSGEGTITLVLNGENVG